MRRVALKAWRRCFLVRLFFLVFVVGEMIFERFFIGWGFFEGKMKACFFGCLFFGRVFRFEWF